MVMEDGSRAREENRCLLYTLDWGVSWQLAEWKEDQRMKAENERLVQSRPADKGEEKSAGLCCESTRRSCGGSPVPLRSPPDFR